MMIDDEMGNCLKRVLENWEFEIDLSFDRVCLCYAASLSLL